MSSKIDKILKIGSAGLLGAMLFSLTPFIAYAYSPHVTTNNASKITYNSATLNASVDENNRATSVWFEYALNPNLNNFFSLSAHKSGSSSRQNSKWAGNIGGLSPNTTYYFRAVAQNRDGRSYGNIRSFTTNYLYENYNNNYYQNSAYPFYPNYNYQAFNPSPSLTATTEPATFVSNSGAQLNSLILNSGYYNSTSTWFEWGTTTNLGNKTNPVSVGSLPSVRHANIMTGLLPGTIYYFRAVAENSSWRNVGSTLSFVTSGTRPITNIVTYTPVARNTNISSKPRTTATTVTPEPEEVVEQETRQEEEDETQPEQSPLRASVVESDPFLPGNIFGWLILIILLLLLILLSKHLHREFSNEKKL